MNTPICDFVREYAEQQALRLHMPGHKGAGALGVESLDITEIDGADVLYQACGIIKQSEDNTAALFGAEKTVFSTEGSSLCIRAMLYLTALYAKAQGRPLRIAAGRNAHQVFMTAAALLDINVTWLYPETANSLHTCDITADSIQQYLESAVEKPIAVYLTSPDYLGNVADITGISEVCHRYGVLLLVDNAHGAYLHFLPESCHPLTLGADVCCDSAHKTLPVLTGGAYLHISSVAPPLFAQQAERAMALFASTSPSYLILQSLDAANAYLAGDYSQRLAQFVQDVWALKKELRRHGYMLCGNEPLKICILPKGYGYTGTEVAKWLQEQNIVCEFADPDFVVLMLTPELGEQALQHLRELLITLPQREAILQWPPHLPKPIQALPMREALFSPSRTVPINDCIGRVLASPSVSCPPAIPIAVCGEQITAETVGCFRYYGIEKCFVTE